MDDMKAISTNMVHRQRTKQGIAKAKGNGVSWGAYGVVLAKQNKDTAQAYAETLRPLFIDLMANHRIKGAATLANALNKRGIKTRSGKAWLPNSVHRVLVRLRPSLGEEVSRARDEAYEKNLGQETIRNELSALNRNEFR